MKQQYLEAGVIAGTHGVRGELKINVWADGPEFLTQFRTCYLDGRPVEIESVRVHKNQVLMKLHGVDDLGAASALRGRVVKINRADAGLAEGKVFVADLIGLPVFAGERQIGQIAEVINMPANDVYVVRGEKEYLIPAVSEFLEEVDVDEGFVRVRLIEGMAADEN